MLSAFRGGNLLGFLSQLAYNSGILSKFVFYIALLIMAGYMAYVGFSCRQVDNLLIVLGGASLLALSYRYCTHRGGRNNNNVWRGIFLDICSSYLVCLPPFKACSRPNEGNPVYWQYDGIS